MDPECEKKKKRKRNKRVHKIDLPTKKLPESMSLKSLNRIKIKKDEVYKEINKAQHHMTWGFKSIEEINRLIKDQKTQNKAGNEHTSSTTSDTNTIIEAEETKEEAKEVPFEIDPKIFESSEECIVSSEQKITNEVISKKEEHKKNLITLIIKKLDDIVNFRASIVRNDPTFDEQNKTINKIIIVLSKLRNGFEKASFNKKYSNDKKIEKEEIKSDSKGVVGNNTTGCISTENKKKKKNRESLPSYKKSNYIRLCINNALIKDIPIDFQELYDTFNCAG